MKNTVLKIMIIAILFMAGACDDNDVVPSYDVAGKSTATVATLEVSTDEPAPAAIVMLTLKYVNAPSDPIKSVVLKASIDGADYIELETFDEQASEPGTEITREVSYEVPDIPGSIVIFDMVISSQKEFPQVKRTSVTVDES